MCPDHETPLEKVEEKTISSRLSTYQDQLIRLIETDQLRIVPATRKTKCSLSQGEVCTTSVFRAAELATEIRFQAIRSSDVRLV